MFVGMTGSHYFTHVVHLLLYNTAVCVSYLASCHVTKLVVVVLLIPLEGGAA